MNEKVGALHVKQVVSQMTVCKVEFIRAKD